MHVTPAAALLAGVFDLNGPGRYVQWSIVTISVANLALIVAMLLIFGAALIIPFPGHGEVSEEIGPGEPSPPGDGASGPPANRQDSRMWTARVRRLAVRLLPPERLLPDRQPAYVASWVYVFGVASIATLALAVVSGLLIAIGGPDWWHTNPVGRFFNSLHLWSVEAFMAFIVIHLWGQFWMAAWRGRRRMTWITGGIAFLASIVECFTGYLSQQNFDSQWISTNGKDAVNSIGLGGPFNLLNFGQMLLWHVVLVPIGLIAIVGAHILLVRVRGVSHPLPARRVRGREARRAARAADAAEWRGPMRRYDIVKELALATLVSTVLVILLAALLSSPNDPPVTVASWAKVAPADFMGTAASELAGTSETATYGPPYNNGTSNVQGVVVSWQTLAGVRIPIDPAQAFVISPLSKLAPTNPVLARALQIYEAAPPSTQSAWDQAYLQAVTHVRFVDNIPVVPRAADGPVPVMIANELALARSGAIDTDLLANRDFYGTDFTKPLLFLEDGEYFASLAQAEHLTGSQWGVMNETGSYPGQPWLWLYTLWYQVPGLNSSSNIDLIAIYLTGVATVLLLAIPFIPGLRDIPEVVPVHRLIWRRWEGLSGDGGNRTSGGPGSP